MAAVPVHFGCPDVFEGASAEVAGFLSVASKGAALALLARFLLVMGGLDPVIDQSTVSGGVKDAPWLGIIRYLVPTLAFFAALTATFRNLSAHRQTNLHRPVAAGAAAPGGVRGQVPDLREAVHRGAELLAERPAVFGRDADRAADRGRHQHGDQRGVLPEGAEGDGPGHAAGGSGGRPDAA